jgi:hypothetical protein
MPTKEDTRAIYENLSDYFRPTPKMIAERKEEKRFTNARNKVFEIMSILNGCCSIDYIVEEGSEDIENALYELKEYLNRNIE